MPGQRGPCHWPLCGLMRAQPVAGSVTYILAWTDLLGAISFYTSHTLPHHYTKPGGGGRQPATTLYLYDRFPKHPEKNMASRQSFVQSSQGPVPVLCGLLWTGNRRQRIGLLSISKQPGQACIFPHLDSAWPPLNWVRILLPLPSLTTPTERCKRLRVWHTHRVPELLTVPG